MQMQLLNLPIRYEVLRRKAEQENADISRIVQRVESANQHIQELFLGMQQTGVSRFEVFYGASGSGKTTFLETLPQFFDNVDVRVITHEVSLANAVDELAKTVADSKRERVIVYFGGTGRDNPTDSDASFLAFFEQLRGYFRDTNKLVLVVWPVSRPETALRLFQLAKSIGEDSLIGNSREYYTFPGPSKTHFYGIADNTCRLINNERSLAEFGIDETIGTGVLAQANTIAEYFQKMLAHANDLNGVFANLLSEKPRPRVWILLPGDDISAVMSTVSSLTQGSRRRLDIAALTTDLAKEQANTQYMKDWARLSKFMPYLLRNLDVRIVEIPPNLALSIVRAFGALESREKLKQKSASGPAAVEMLKESMLGQLLLESEPKPLRQYSKTGDETADEFIRIQSTARGSDAVLNAAFASAIQELLSNIGRTNVTVGKKVEIYNSLRPDIHVSFASNEPICLEFTWRTTGRQVEGVQAGRQNTLTPGHIRPYVLQKVYEYVKALGLDEIGA